MERHCCLSTLYVFFTSKFSVVVRPPASESAREGSRTPTVAHWILSPARLPVPPLSLFDCKGFFVCGQTFLGSLSAFLWPSHNFTVNNFCRILSLALVQVQLYSPVSPIPSTCIRHKACPHYQRYVNLLTWESLQGKRERPPVKRVLT